MASRGFLDKVLRFMGIQEEELVEDDDVHMPVAAPAFSTPTKTGDDVISLSETRKKPRLVSIPGAGKGTGQMKVSVVYPKAYDDVQPIADHLKNRQPVIVSLDGMEAGLSRRIVDFMSGVTYALEGRIHRIGEGIFLVAPANVTIDAMDALMPAESNLFDES